MFEGAFAQVDFVEELDDGAISATQRGLVDLLVVGGAVLPAAPDDALPFEGQGAHGRVMGRTLCPLLQVVSCGPATPEDALLGVFVEALLVEFGAEIAAMNVTRASAALGDRRHAGVALHVARLRITLPLRTHGAQQARSEGGSGSRQAGEDGVILMLGVGLGDLFVEVGEGLLQELELAGDELDAQDEAVDDGALVGHGHGFVQEGQALFQESLAAGTVEIIEGFKGGGIAFANGLQAGPLEEKAGGQWAPEILAAQDQSERRAS